jgi:hypothetical protein
VSSFLENVIRRGAGLSHEAFPRPLPGADLPPALGDPSALEDETALESHPELEEREAASVGDADRLRQRDPAPKLSSAPGTSQKSHLITPASPDLNKKMLMMLSAPEEPPEVEEGYKTDRSSIERQRTAKPLSPRVEEETALLRSTQLHQERRRRLSDKGLEEDAGVSGTRTLTGRSGVYDFDASDTAAVSELSHERAAGSVAPAPFQGLDALPQLATVREATSPPHPLTEMRPAEPDASHVVFHPHEPYKADAITSALSDAGAERETQSTSQRVDVRIGSIEVRVTSPPEYEGPGQPRLTRGFGKYSLARRYLDRKWY